MNEYKLYLRILASKYRANDRKLFVEEKDKNSKVEVVNYKEVEYSSYRFDMDNENFLPMFNNTHTHGETSEYRCPKYLLSFCDYIVLAVVKEKMFVLLIEMKSENNDKARKQIEASEKFMDYVKETAIRIAPDNRYSFDENNIEIRRIVLKPKSRTTTNPIKYLKKNWDNNGINFYPGTSFDIKRACLGYN